MVAPRPAQHKSVLSKKDNSESVNIIERKEKLMINNEKEVPILYYRKEECCGCTACYAICPKQAISMVEDQEGFSYPQINGKKCVRCYKCIRVCPIRGKKKHD